MGELGWQSDFWGLCGQPDPSCSGALGGSKCRAPSSERAALPPCRPCHRGSMGHSGLRVQQAGGSSATLHMSPASSGAASLGEQMVLWHWGRSPWLADCTHWALAWHCRRGGPILGEGVGYRHSGTRSSSLRKGSC